MASNSFSKQLILVVDGIRKEKKLSVADFVKHFEITEQAYYAWLRSTKKGMKIIRPKLEHIERGLESLGYDPYAIITKRDRE